MNANIDGRVDSGADSSDRRTDWDKSVKKKRFTIDRSKFKTPDSCGKCLIF